MGMNVAQKIITGHVVEGRPVPGEAVGIRIDQTLTQDATGTMAYLEFEAMGVDRVRTELSVSYVDHNTLQEGFENADDHRYLRTVAARFGVHYSRAGNGICHQVHLERFGRPGRTLLGSDSHTPTGGGIGMIAIGAGGIDVAVAMGGGPFFLVYPRVVGVRLHGRLRPWVSAKDVILKVLEILTTKGNVGWVAEYMGDGVAGLGVPERATIANMGAELGVTTSVFPSDDVTRGFLRAQGREDVWSPLEADPDAQYDRVIEIDLDRLEPMCARPHSPDNVVPVRELRGTRCDQVLIGSCTNSSYRDLMVVAGALEGRRVHPDVSFGVAPGSRQVFEMIARNGALARIIAAGARVLESTCGFCIGAGQAPGTNAVSVRTNNRNFEGRSGTRSAQVYLASPETAVATAIAGDIVDPRDFFGEKAYPKVEMPGRFHIDDSMIIPPAEDPRSVEILRGPNIGELPRGAPMADALEGEVSLKVGDKITTDHIMPAGPLLKYRSNVPRYAGYVFGGVDPEFAARAAANRDAGRANVIVGGDSYGQGSSREHAALCPMFLGVKAVLVKAFERIHRANLVNFGIIPLRFKNPEDYDRISRGDAVAIRGIHRALDEGGGLVVRNETKGAEFPVEVDLTPRERAILRRGGLLNYTRG